MRLGPSSDCELAAKVLSYNCLDVLATLAVVDCIALLDLLLKFLTMSQPWVKGITIFISLPHL